MAIQVISAKEFKVQSGGHSMTLTQDEKGDWVMWTRNASTQAWNRGFPSFKPFPSLAAVAKHYKSWNGIEEIAAAALADEVIVQAKAKASA